MPGRYRSSKHVATDTGWRGWRPQSSLLAARCGANITIYGYDERKLKGDGSESCKHKPYKCKTCKYEATVSHCHRAGAFQPGTHQQNRGSGLKLVLGVPHGKRHGSKTARPASITSHVIIGAGQPVLHLCNCARPVLLLLINRKTLIMYQR